MADQVLYVYAVAREPVTPEVEGVGGSPEFGSVEESGLCAIYSSVSREEFSQEEIDRRATDMEWLGAIGYRHQDVVAALAKQTPIVPLRAFTLFSSEDALRDYLERDGELLANVLGRIGQKQEWTLRIEFDAQKWSGALAHRVASLKSLEDEIDSAAPGRAFLLRKKLDDERKKASREAEQQLVGEIERAIVERLACDAIAELREQRGGAFPQINVLIERDEEARLQQLHAELMDRYEPEGVAVEVTGPWPPYTFAHV